MYNPETGKGMGSFFDIDHKAMTKREWKGFKDTFYEFGRWLKLYGYMGFKLGRHPILMVKAMLRYRWMISYLTAANTIDKLTIGLYGKEFATRTNISLQLCATLSTTCLCSSKEIKI